MKMKRNHEVTKNPDLVNVLCLSPQTSNEINVISPPNDKNYSCKLAKLIVEHAIQHQKVFTLTGRYRPIRSGLLRRGWLEKKGSSNSKKKSNAIKIPDEIMDLEMNCKDYLRLLETGQKTISKIIDCLLKDVTPNFIWTRKRTTTNFCPHRTGQLINHFSSGSFTTKASLNTCLRQVHWFGEDLHSFYPRSYFISEKEEKMAFIDDFRLTACLGVVKWVVDFTDNAEFRPLVTDLEKETAAVPCVVIEMAMQQCKNYLQFKKHQDLDKELETELDEEKWKLLSKHYYNMNKKRAFMFKNPLIIWKCREMLHRFRKSFPYLESTGFQNIWIVKPAAFSRGWGIKIFDKLSAILTFLESKTEKSNKYIVQKYIERPLLIYGTKFDIRQWFLVTDWNPLMVYFYKQSYLRFCHDPFSLHDKSEVIHLSSNSIQKKYLNDNVGRSDGIPAELMWCSVEFENYLAKCKNSTAWNDIIYPGMKKAIIKTLLCAQESVEYQKGAFELFGADFMLTEDFVPWLIEINASPCIAASTSVTSRLCSTMLEDMLRVVIDRRKNEACNIGKFELVFNQTPIVLPKKLNFSLIVEGTALKLSARSPRQMQQKSEDMKTITPKGG